MDWVGNGNKIQPLCVCVFWFRCSSSAQTKKGEETPAIDVAPSTVSTCNNQHEATKGMHNVGVTTMMDRGTQNFKNLLPTDYRGRIMFRQKILYSVSVSGNTWSAINLRCRYGCCTILSTDS